VGEGVGTGAPALHGLHGRLLRHCPSVTSYFHDCLLQTGEIKLSKRIETEQCTARSYSAVLTSIVYTCRPSSTTHKAILLVHAQPNSALSWVTNGQFTPPDTTQLDRRVVLCRAVLNGYQSATVCACGYLNTRLVYQILTFSLECSIKTVINVTNCIS